MTQNVRSNDYSSWAVGWAGFAGVMLIILGILDAIQGLTALFNDTFYVVGEEWLFEFNVTTWGWIHLIGGIILVLAGVGIFSGNVAARTVGVIIASLSALWNFAWLPYYPVWSIILIAIAIAVIWALTAHGRDITYND
ncbi:MAG: hypothetical protein QNM02_00765 [Acidimicrobiia bacterium]|nr:hypothetical protein [Acidimicrobiia bacterium]